MAESPNLAWYRSFYWRIAITFVAFVILILIAHLAMPGDPLIFWGAIVWGVARIAYLPLYLAGTFMIRSLVWNVALIGLLMMAWAVLF